MNVILKLVLGVCFFLLAFLSFNRIDISLESKDGNQIDEVLYLPNKEAVEVVSFGYKHFAADLIWFNTINYFGKHYREDKKFTWLKHMCDLTTNLNPNAKHFYEFCGLMLSWDCLLYTSPSPRDRQKSRMPSSA